MSIINNIIKDITDTVSYVYGDLEVKLTGRVATRTVENKYKPEGGGVKELVEITPVDPDITWKKFVTKSDLYEIK
jgi:hypothetical protein